MANTQGGTPTTYYDQLPKPNSVVATGNDESPYTPDANKGVVDYGDGGSATPQKNIFLNNPVNPQNDYLATFRQAQEAAKREEESRVPTAKEGGKGMNSWIQRVFSKPKTTEGARRTIQAITGVGNMLRHAGNLYYTSKGATPQTIADQNAINDAKWKQEDALQAERDAKQREWERKVAKDMADADYKDRTLALRQADLYEKMRNNEFNRNITGTRFGWETEDRPLTQQKKKADADYATAKATEQEVIAKNAEAIQKATLEKLNTQIKSMKDLIVRRHSGGGGGGGHRGGGGHGGGRSGGSGKITKEYTSTYMGRFGVRRELDGTQKHKIVLEAHNAGCVNDAVYNRYTNKEISADKIIANMLYYCNSKTAKGILLRNGMEEVTIDLGLE